MNKTINNDAMVEFNMAMAGKSSITPYEALFQLTKALVGVKLFTVMETDLVNNIAQRSYTSDPQSYPASGCKPVERDDWFNLVFTEQKAFVANTIDDIVKVFPDHELIWSLGCGSVVNLPIVIDGDAVGCINLLHEEHFYTKARLEQIVKSLTVPCQTAYLRAQS